MKAYRDSQTSPLGAMQYSDSGGATKYAAKPSVTDFRCDVDRVITKCVRDKTRFFLAYVYFDSEDEIEREVYAEKIIGPTRHNLEEGMGAEFLRRRLCPTHGKRGYFTAIRKKERADEAQKN